MCVGPPTSLADQIQGRFNISWDPLPCHLQNGADVSGYTIQYTQLSTGLATNISNHHNYLLCDQESGGPYSCQVANSLFNPDQAYTFQVAANNNEGVGSFSDPITKSIPIRMLQGTCIDHVINTPLYTKPNLFLQTTSTIAGFIQFASYFQIIQLLVSLMIHSSLEAQMAVLIIPPQCLQM